MPGRSDSHAVAEVYVVCVTGPDRSTLVEIARAVVEERLAACANVCDGLTSVFRWKGELQEEREALALLKTTAQRLPALRDRVTQLHAYDVPEFLALSVDSGSSSYVAWIAESVGLTESEGKVAE